MKRGLPTSLIAAAAIAYSVSSQATPGAEDGLYAHIYTPNMSSGNPRYSELENAITNSGIDGVSLVAHWDDVEPVANTYDWSGLSHWLTLAIQHDKKISIGVTSGNDSPSWLAQAPYSVPTVSLGWDKNGALGSNNSSECEYSNFPLPWKATYKSRYLKMMTSLHDYLQGFTVSGYPNTALSRVQIVKIGGITIGTNEIRLPRSSSANTHCLPAGGIDNDTAWLNAGFKPNKILAAWEAIASGVAAEFNGKQLAIEVISNYDAFPNYTNQGVPVPGPNSGDNLDPITESIIESGRITYGTRFHVAWDALGTNTSNPIYTELQDNVTDSSFLKKGELGFQLNQRGGVGTTGCGNNLHICTQTEFEQVLQNGINFGAKYLEIHTNDASRFPASMFSTYSNLIQ